MRRILLIEDDSHLRPALCVRLRAEGFQVYDASDLDSGIKLAMETDPHLVLMDVMLPNGSGIALAGALRSLNSFAAPIVLMTGSKDPAISALAKQIGVSALFEKPLNTSELLRTIQRLLARARARD